MNARKGIAVAGVIILAVSLFFGLIGHYREVCRDIPFRGEKYCRDVIIGYSLAPWSISLIIFGAALLLLGIALLVYPKLEARKREKKLMRPLRR